MNDITNEGEINMISNNTGPVSGEEKKATLIDRYEEEYKKTLKIIDYDVEELIKMVKK
ncbi:MAG: hypothetical protein KAR56_02290 [Thermoplasmata archaeon]|nr:hypothetical protein [Thermoplasmata archaeon]